MIEKKCVFIKWDKDILTKIRYDKFAAACGSFVSWHFK